MFKRNDIKIHNLPQTSGNKKHILFFLFFCGISKFCSNFLKYLSKANNLESPEKTETLNIPLPFI